ncbi:hypothetical protein EDD86DRAFT_221237 [Gorgonomyces haynaldii]|nr:hypothetical protein EDD86DRAFT_221237 [Gorgonomyces haynaldii]
MATCYLLCMLLFTNILQCLADPHWGYPGFGGYGLGGWGGYRGWNGGYGGWGGYGGAGGATIAGPSGVINTRYRRGHQDCDKAKSIQVHYIAVKDITDQIADLLSRKQDISEKLPQFADSWNRFSNVYANRANCFDQPELFMESSRVANSLYDEDRGDMTEKALRLKQLLSGIGNQVQQSCGSWDSQRQ